MLLLLLGCRYPAPADSKAVEPPAPPPIVLLITVDTINKRFLGMNHDWDTTPNLDALFAESTVLSTVTSPRGLSSPSMASFLTGVYPRKHGIRQNGDAPNPTYDYLQTRFKAAGYTTYGFSSNQCHNIDMDIDVRMCTWEIEEPDLGKQHHRDELLVDALVPDIAAHASDSPMYVWLHFMDPHETYDPVEPWYSEYHPEPYTGTFDPGSEESINEVVFEERGLDEADLAHLYAVYASQIRETDAFIGEVLDAFRARGWYDNALIVFGIDHGETLFGRNNYPYHGCSYYNEVLDVTWAFRAPGKLPAGVVRTERVSNVDVAPTIVELAGLTWSGDADGQSLVTALATDGPIERTVFFERDTNAAGIIADELKYVLNPYQSFDLCVPYNLTDLTYTTPPIDIFDLRTDPDEQHNLADTPPEAATALRAQLCAWLREGPWESTAIDQNNELLLSCAE